MTLRRELEQTTAAEADALHLVSGETVAALPPCEAPDSMKARGARYLNPVCGIAVEIASAKHVIDYGGQLFYFCCDCCKLEFEREPEKYLAIAQGNAQLEKT